MPNVSVVIPHKLDEQEANQRLRDRYEAAKAAYREHIQNLEEQWDDTSLRCRFSTFGMNFRAAATTTPGEVRVAFEMPLVAMMFKGTIEKQIREELEKVLT